MRVRVTLLVVLILVAAVAGFFFWSNAQNVAGGSPTPPVLVDIITPANGISIQTGDTFSILAQAWSPNPVTIMELWEDGERISSESVQGQDGAVHYSWDLQPSQLGVHTFFVRAVDSEGEQGQSSTLILNVAAGGFQHVNAAGGETLAGIAEQTGLPVGEIASLNPGLDAAQPLADGQPLILPPSSSDGNEQNVPADSGVPDLVIQWKFTPTNEDVNNSYCYQSVGGENWQRVPDQPFSFLPGGEWLQTYFSLPAVQQLTLFLECWGWQAGELTYLGEGQTNLDYVQVPDELVIAGPGFEAEGLPEMKPLSAGGIPDEPIPPPFALRQPQTVSECASHYGGNFWANVVCDELMNASTKQYNLYVWEWSPGFCWGACPWEQIDGYLFYEYDASYQTLYKVKEIPNGDQKVTAAPLPWGGRCYAVTAYADTLTEGRIESYATSFCGEQPETETMVLSPSDWLSSEGMWINQGCDEWADAFRLKPTGSQMVVGFFLFAVDKYCDIKQGGATAAVQFNNLILPPEAVLQRATLKFTPVDVAFEVPDEVAVNYSAGSCATRVGKAKSDWTALSSAHFINPDTLGPYYSAYTSAGSPWDGGERAVDVTSAVLGWMDDPSTNHGFVLIADVADLYNSYLFESGWDVKICYSLLDNVELEIEYFAPN